MSIEVMKQALEALQQTTLEDRLVQIGPLDWEYQGTLAIQALRQAISEAEQQKPVLWLAIGRNGRVKYTTDSDRAISWKQSGSHLFVRGYYTAPVTKQAEKREWVGLTEQEIDAAVKSCNTVDTYKYFRAIEAKLKEKNG